MRTVKDFARSVYNDALYQRIPKPMTISLMKGIERWLNMCPPISENLGSLASPTVLVDRKESSLYDRKYKK